MDSPRPSLSNDSSALSKVTPQPADALYVVAQAESDEEDEILEAAPEAAALAIAAELAPPQYAAEVVEIPPAPAAEAAEHAAEAASAAEADNPAGAADLTEQDAEAAGEAEAATEAAARAAPRGAAANAPEAAGGRKSRRHTAGLAPARFAEEHVAPRLKRARQVRDDAPQLPVEAPPAGPDSEWVQCDLCMKWRIVKCAEIEILPENAPWICSMNSDVRDGRSNVWAVQRVGSQMLGG